MTVTVMPQRATDPLGLPIAILSMHEPSTSVDAFLVIDSLMPLGGSGGGVRMMTSVTLEEVTRLARAMTYKYGSMGAPSGGAKLGIAANPRQANKSEILRGVARLIAPLVKADVYRFGEDMGTTKEDVMLMYREIGVDPIELGRARAARRGYAIDLPPDVKISSLGGEGFAERITGFGVAEVFAEACDVLGFDAHHLRVAIQGFGTVGGELARLLSLRGVRVTTIADARGTMHCDDGLDVNSLLAARNEFGEVDRNNLSPSVAVLPPEAWLQTDAEVIVAAAVKDAITIDVVPALRCKLIIEAANIPIPADADHALFERGIPVIPDFVASAGSAAGYAMIWGNQTTPIGATAAVGKRIREITSMSLRRSIKRNVSPRSAARELALENMKELGMQMNFASTDRSY